jgi:H+-translocating NAD(P) transhydrogenase subunit beta
LSYLVAAVCLIVCIKRLSHPRTARSGNLVAAFGMAIAILFTLFDRNIDDYWLMALGIAIGTVVGVASARMVRMTAMPQMVALFNGVGGGAAALIAAAEFHDHAPDPDRLAGDQIIGILFSALAGSVSFWGSIVAFGKLQDVVPGRPIVFPAQNAINALVGAALIVLIALTAATEDGIWLALLFPGALILGVLFVLPIGGADMPIVISLLNAFTGLSAAAAGIALNNTALIVAGMIVGASGSILTNLMAQAMNRSIPSIVAGGFGGVVTAGGGGDDGDKTVRSTSASDAAVQMAYASQVVIVPGYGMAVAQAQHAVREMADALQEKGITVLYAIHEVAGRMPGHMNVLLAEADVDYDQLKETAEINPEFPRSDVALVIGANDVTNPAAKTDESSPIYGMPILDVAEAQSVIVIKRSMNPGFAGIDNDLYYEEKTQMLFGDAKEMVAEITGELEGL